MLVAYATMPVVDLKPQPIRATCSVLGEKKIVEPLPCFPSAVPPELEWGWLINMIHCCLLAVKAGVKLLVPAGLALLTQGLMRFALGNGDTQHHAFALPHE